jgi:hypothetical protein
MRKMTILLAATLTMLTSPVLADQSGAAPNLGAAKAFLTRLYASYRQKVDPPDYLGAKHAPAVFTPHLVELIRLDEKTAGGEVGILDSDPICACQDWVGLKLQNLTVSPAGPGKARADVVLNYSPDIVRLTFDLEDQGKGWRIADIHSQDTPSLVGLLEDGLKEQGKATGRKQP